MRERASTLTLFGMWNLPLLTLRKISLTPVSCGSEQDQKTEFKETVLFYFCPHSSAFGTSQLNKITILVFQESKIEMTIRNMYLERELARE